MKVELDKSSNPYILDKIKNKNLIALSRKNVDFLKAVIGLDSNYKSDLDENNNKSTIYWFKRMQNHPQDYKNSLKNVIEQIDRANSTHLESTKNGRTKMLEIILNNCPTIDKLKSLISINPSLNDYNNLFFKLCETMENQKGNKANNLSFASKFISCARKYLNDDASFSKYDSVVSKMLSAYENAYINNDIKIIKSKYQNDSNKRKKMTDLQKQIYTYETYIKYMNAINNILSYLKNDNNVDMNKEEFDLIVWYSFKGK